MIETDGSDIESVGDEPQLDEQSGEQPRHRPRKSARDKLMDYLARRDHSEFELRKKLSFTYTATEVDNAIQFARENRWLAEPDELSSRVTEQLNRKNKGARYIEKFLRSRGLPGTAKDPDEELRKARELIQVKLNKQPPYEFAEQVKIHRFLAYRGFDEETIRKVMHEKP